ncbi:MAG: hypothetical protein P8I93_03155 [Crocinitomicaceae bacterium]|nr:hypothetical protein [Crocinitomicaceae bacterium]
MKYSLLFSFILLCTFLTSQENARDKASDSWLIADNVNLRESPKNGKILTNLPIASKIKVLGPAESPNKDWLKVVYTKGKKKITGYLLDEFIAEKTLMNKETNTIFLFRTMGMEKNKWGFLRPKIQLRVAKNHKELSKVFFDGENEDSYYLKINDGKGLEGVQNIISVDFPQECCACPTGILYFFWNGNKIIHAFSVYDGVDVPAFGRTALIYPEDNGGLSNSIIELNYSGSYGEGEMERDVIEDVQTTFHYWDSKAEKLNVIFPHPEQKK